MANLATSSVNSATVATRSGEVPNALFTGGMNAGGCNMGVGICTDVFDPKVSDWTTLDQDGLARTPQNSQHIGGSGLGDGDQTVAPITVVNGVDINDTAAFAVADQVATNGQVFNTTSGAINVGTTTIQIGQRAWGAIPVA